jgi:hypothetical protein
MEFDEAVAGSCFCFSAAFVPVERPFFRGDAVKPVSQIEFEKPVS